MQVDNTSNQNEHEYDSLNINPAQDYKSCWPLYKATLLQHI